MEASGKTLMQMGQCCRQPKNDWQEYIGKLETGASKPEKRTKVIEAGASPKIEHSACGSGTGAADGPTSLRQWELPRLGT